MEVTDELKDHSYRKIGDDCLKKKKFITKYVRFFFYCKVYVSVISFSHTSEEGKNLLDSKEISKEESLKFHFLYMFSDYVMFLFGNKRCYSSNIQLFWLRYSYIF